MDQLPVAVSLCSHVLIRGKINNLVQNAIVRFQDIKSTDLRCFQAARIKITYDYLQIIISNHLHNRSSQLRKAQNILIQQSNLLKKVTSTWKQWIFVVDYISSINSIKRDVLQLIKSKKVGTIIKIMDLMILIHDQLKVLRMNHFHKLTHLIVMALLNSNSSIL